MGLFKKKDRGLVAVADGVTIPLEEVKDEVIAQKILGDGIAIIPSNGKVSAPCSGKITVLANTLHAFAITTDDGLEVMVHIGIDTVELKGKGFRTCFSEGNKVKKGQTVVEFDPLLIKEGKYDMTISIVVTNYEEYPIKTVNVKKNVVSGRDVIIEY